MASRSVARVLYSMLLYYGVVSYDARCRPHQRPLPA